MPRFRHLPTEIDAEQWDGADLEKVREVARGGQFQPVEAEDRGDDPERTAEVFDFLHGSWIGVRDGQWVAKGTRGEHWAVDPDVFAETYEPVPDGTAPAGTPAQAGATIPPGLTPDDVGRLVAVAQDYDRANCPRDRQWRRVGDRQAARIITGALLALAAEAGTAADAPEADGDGTAGAPATEETPLCAVCLDEPAMPGSEFGDDCGSRRAARGARGSFGGLL